jgi:flap endonuclease-1
VTISGRRKLPSKNVYVEVVPEVVELEQVLKELRITHEQLIDVGILVGTDFNPEGVKGLGPKTALKLIKEYGSLENALPYLKMRSSQLNHKKLKKFSYIQRLQTTTK